MYTANETLTKEDFGPVGAFKTWLLANKMSPLPPWLPKQEHEIHNKIISHNGGYAGPVNWYVAAVNNVNSADEAKIPASAIQIQSPVLLITALGDAIGIPPLAINGTVPYAKNIRIKPIDSGHFVQVEKSALVNEYLEEFFEEVLRDKTRYL